MAFERDVRTVVLRFSLLLSCLLGTGQAYAADTPADARPAACPRCCQVKVEAAPRVGLSVNGDQWLVGSALRASLPCLGELGIGPTLALGVGGNHLTLRSGGRLDYLLWFDDAHTFAIYPSVGAALQFYWPVGNFATFCHRVDLDECSGYHFGNELGGGVRYGNLAVDAFAGFGGLPVLSVMAAWSFAFTPPERR